MSRKAATKGKKGQQRGDAAAQAIDDDTYYVLRVNLTGAPVVPFPFTKDLYLKVTSRPPSVLCCVMHALRNKDACLSERLVSQPGMRTR